MTGDGSAYAILGLDPAADSDEIERAYRRLIKQHHPDREGGDGRRAADINRAYRELRGDRDLKEPLEIAGEWPEQAGRRHRWPLLAVVLATAAAALLLSQSTFLPFRQARSPSKPERLLGSHGKMVTAHEPMDQPLNLAAIDTAALDALRLARTRDEMALASRSGDCHHQLRNQPSVLQLDRCAAFDDAVVELEDRDPMRDQGPFSELAVTGRIWSGASALSEDSMAIDGRLDRIRLRVELTLANASSSPSGSR